MKINTLFSCFQDTKPRGKLVASSTNTSIDIVSVVAT